MEKNLQTPANSHTTTYHYHCADDTSKAITAERNPALNQSQQLNLLFEHDTKSDLISRFTSSYQQGRCAKSSQWFLSSARLLRSIIQSITLIFTALHCMQAWSS